MGPCGEITFENNIVDIKPYTQPPEAKVRIVLIDPEANIKALLDDEEAQIERKDGKIIYDTTYENHVFQLEVQE